MQEVRIGSVAQGARVALKEAVGKVKGGKRLQAEDASEKAAAQIRSALGGMGTGQRARASK